MSEYYVYTYLRETASKNGPAGSPYYVGKGKGRRYRSKGQGEVRPPRDSSLITMTTTGLTEQQAFDLERQLIAEYGRIDLGTGILRNKTDGGEGSSGLKHTKEWCDDKAEQTRKWRADHPGWAPRHKGFTQTAEHVDKRMIAHRGAKRSEQACANISAGKYGCKSPKEIVTCPHCDLTGASNNLRRYHFDKCKHKQT